MLKSILTFFSVFAVLAGAVHAAAPEGERFTTMQWRMSLDADGRITALVPKGDQIEALRVRTERAIHQWEFVPGSVDGKLAATETVLSVQIGLLPSADGSQFSVRLKDVRMGGSVSKETEVARYIGNELRSRSAKLVSQVGQVVLEVSYDGSGKSTGIGIASGSPTKVGPLIPAAEKAVRKWIYEPERVAGVGVPGKLIVTICFTLAMSDVAPDSTSNSCSWTLPGSEVSVKQGSSLALDSQVRLKTDISTSTL